MLFNHNWKLKQKNNLKSIKKKNPPTTESAIYSNYFVYGVDIKNNILLFALLQVTSTDSKQHTVFRRISGFFAN